MLKTQPQKLAYTVAEFAAATSLPLSTVYEYCRTGKLASRKIGRRVLIPAKEGELAISMEYYLRRYNDLNTQANESRKR